MSNVSVIIPCLDEPYLPRLLRRLQEYSVRVHGEKGLSFAVWSGIQKSSGNLIVVMDADGSHSPDAIPRMLKLLDDDVWLVIGSKYCRGGYSWDSTPRKVISLFYCAVARIALRTSIQDPMSGFWAGYRWAFDFQPTTSFKFGVQLIKKHKTHIAEYPIVFQKRKKGRSKVKPLQALKDLFAIVRR